MLHPEDVAKDEEIFRPDGFIVFPRSDGDPSYGPPNTVVPPDSDPEVNYYHIFSREERQHDTWRSALGEQLAQYFKADRLSRTKTKWKLYDFPENYIFTEQRKGPQRDYRTDPYLFGSQAHRFRSTKEALDHLVWLLLDPDMNPANCKCKYCHKGPRPAKDADTPKKAAQGTKRKAEPLTASAAAKSDAGRKPKDPNAAPSPASETSITVRGVDMRRLTPGLTIASVPQRDQETMHELKRGERERFRAGEVVWCELDQPIVDPTASERRITSWPAVVLDPSIDSVVMDAYKAQTDEKKTSLEAVSAPSERAASPPALGGSVQQTMSYHINFLGTLENVKAPESSLIPYLSGLIPGEIFESDAGQPEEHKWLSDPNEFLHVNLARQSHLPAPDFTKAVVVFAYAIESAAYLRGMFNLTDAYSGSDTPEGMLRDLGASNSDANGQPAQGLRYYQGIHFGLERIWVGDVVRLRLGITDLRKLQRQLNAALVDDKAPGAPDPPAIVLDEDVSYVLQLSAIYEDPKTPKNVRVSGEVFQIMPQSKYNLLQKDMNVKVAKLVDDATQDDPAAQLAQLEEARMLQLRLPKPSVLVGKPGFPPMPPLPPGFVMLSLSERLQSKIPREITLSIGHVAGRIYPSLGMHSDAPRVAEQIKQRPSDKKLAADEDTQVELRARLSLAGLLPGCVKAMKGSGPLHTWTRGASLKASLALARHEIWNLINGIEEVKEEKKTPKKAKKEAIATPMETTSDAGKAEDVADIAAAETAIATEPEVQKTVEQVRQNEAGVSTEANSEADEPPLPPGWVTRQSRNLGGYYYVHLETKKTQWERPTA